MDKREAARNLAIEIPLFDIRYSVFYAGELP